MVPAGLHQRHAAVPASSTTYVYAAGSWASPLAHLPALTSPTVAVRFCPLLLRLRPETPAAADVAALTGAELRLKGGAVDPAAAAEAAAGVEKSAADGPAPPLVQLPYRMLFAVATLDSVIIYDTQVCRFETVYGVMSQDIPDVCRIMIPCRCPADWAGWTKPKP